VTDQTPQPRSPPGVSIPEPAALPEEGLGTGGAPRPVGAMSTPVRKALLAICAVLGAALACAATASASRTQESMIQDDTLLLQAGPEVRSQTLDEIKALGVDIVKARVSWRDLAPDMPVKPAGFDGSSPAEYPDERWQPYDDIVRGAEVRGLKVLFLLGGRAPDWATAGRSSTPGTNRPNPDEFQRFVQAVGTRYSGTYPPGAALPRVSTWSVWNEPNLNSWLAPQKSGKRRTPVAPSVYRRLVYAAKAGLDASNHGEDALLIGELLPFGRSESSKKLRPIEFMREMACVGKSYRAYRGSAARARGCEDFRPIPGTGFAFHPYTPAGGPQTVLSNRDDASIRYLSRITRALDRLGARGRLTTQRMPVYVTEFGFQTDPPDIFQSPLGRVPTFMGESEYLAWRNPRVLTYAQYPLRDDQIKGGGLARYSGFQSGLRFFDGREKPRVYEAFRLPFFVRVLSPSRVQIFGGVRGAAPGQEVQIQSMIGGSGWQPLGTTRTGPKGYFRITLRASVARSRSYRPVVGELTGPAARAAKR
jgi:hypothetical protein